MIVYKYFLGCTNYQEVKTKFRELAKVHHPDKPTGNKETFQELVDEYAMLGEGDYYPIRNSMTTTQIHEQVNNVYNRKYPKTPDEAYQEQTTNLNQEELEKERAINHFNTIRVGDIIFDYIDEIVAQAKKENLNKLWIYQEISKKWDLSIEHFKYITFLNKDKVSVARELFRKYQLSMV